ncbi:hypothetical protein Gpo141_00014400 [Globisporangium polare]
MSTEALTGEIILPTSPMRAASEHMKSDFAERDTAGLLTAFRESFGVLLPSSSKLWLQGHGSAHHLDEFFSSPMNPPVVTQARETALQYIRKWS